MFPTTILATALAPSALTTAASRVYTSTLRGPNGTCTMQCNVQLDGRYGCNNTVAFPSECFQRGAGEAALPVPGCNGFSLRYFVLGYQGAGSGGIQVIDKATPERDPYYTTGVGERVQGEEGEAYGGGM